MTLLVWPCLPLTEKQGSQSHDEAFAKPYLFFSICFGKKKKKKKEKNADEIKFLGILEKICLHEQNMFLF